MGTVRVRTEERVHVREASMRMLRRGRRVLVKTIICTLVCNKMRCKCDITHILWIWSDTAMDFG